MKIDKLVRDKIPELIAYSGQKATFRILTKPEYIEYLEKKLDEEVAEFHESKDLEELADILEVIHALAREKANTPNEFRDLRLKKTITHGVFSKRILLVEMED